MVFRRVNISQAFRFDAAMLGVTYEEGGRQYREKLIAAIHGWGQMAAGMWENKETFLVRAAPAEFDRLAPVLAVLQGSVEVHPQWVVGDMFLNLTGQEEYVNPHTGKAELGSNQWRYRWVSPSGEAARSARADPGHAARAC